MTFTCVGARFSFQIRQPNGESGDRQMLQGWWGHRLSTRFDMNNGKLNCFFVNALCISVEMELSEGFGAYRISNPPPVLFGPLFASLEVGVLFITAFMS